MSQQMQEMYSLKRTVVRRQRSAGEWFSSHRRWRRRSAWLTSTSSCTCRAIRRQLPGTAPIRVRRPPTSVQPTTAILTLACVTASLQWHQHKKSSERATNVENHATFRLVQEGEGLIFLYPFNSVCGHNKTKWTAKYQQQGQNKIMRANWEPRAYLIKTCHVINSLL